MEGWKEGRQEESLQIFQLKLKFELRCFGEFAVGARLLLRAEALLFVFIHFHEVFLSVSTADSSSFSYFSEAPLVRTLTISGCNDVRSRSSTLRCVAETMQMSLLALRLSTRGFVAESRASELCHHTTLQPNAVCVRLNHIDL